MNPAQNIDLQYTSMETLISGFEQSNRFLDFLLIGLLGSTLDTESASNMAISVVAFGGTAMNAYGFVGYNARNTYQGIHSVYDKTCQLYSRIFR